MRKGSAKPHIKKCLSDIGGATPAQHQLGEPLTAKEDEEEEDAGMLVHLPLKILLALSWEVK